MPNTDEQRGDCLVRSGRRVGRKNNLSTRDFSWSQNKIIGLALGWHHALEKKSGIAEKLGGQSLRCLGEMAKSDESCLLVVLVGTDDQTTIITIKGIDSSHSWQWRRDGERSILFNLNRQHWATLGNNGNHKREGQIPVLIARWHIWVDWDARLIVSTIPLLEQKKSNGPFCFGLRID